MPQAAGRRPLLMEDTSCAAKTHVQPFTIPLSCVFRRLVLRCCDAVLCRASGAFGAHARNALNESVASDGRLPRGTDHTVLLSAGAKRLSRGNLRRCRRLWQSMFPVAAVGVRKINAGRWKPTLPIHFFLRMRPINLFLNRRDCRQLSGRKPSC